MGLYNHSVLNSIEIIDEKKWIYFVYFDLVSSVHISEIDSINKSNSIFAPFDKLNTTKDLFYDVTMDYYNDNHIIDTYSQNLEKCRSYIRTLLEGFGRYKRYPTPRFIWFFPSEEFGPTTTLDSINLQNKNKNLNILSNGNMNYSSINYGKC